MGKQSFRVVISSALLAVLAACGGGGGDAGSDSAAVDSAPLIGSAGGTVSHASGAAVIVPPGGTQGDVTIRIAMDSTGAPPWSPTLTAAGDIYAVTPHGARFSAPAQVRLPIGPALLGLDGTLMMAKAQSGGSGWTLLNGAVREGDTLVAKVDSFSFFRVVVVPRPVTIAPFDVHAEAVSCTPGSVIPGGFGCLIDGGGSTMAARIQISGQALAGCDLRAPVALSVTAYPTRSSNPLTPAANAKIVLIDKQELTGQAATPLDLRPLPPRTITLNPTLVPWFGYENILLQVTTDCYDWQPGPFANSQPTLVAVSQQWRPLAMMFGAAQFAANALFANGRQYNPIAWVQQPDAPVGVEGQPLRLGAVLTGGASLGNLIDTTGSDPTWRPPSENDAATVDWERSEDGGVSWRPVSRSWEYDADPDPYHAGRPWRFWGTGTDLPSLTRQDAAALFRGRACYTIPGQSQVCHNSQGKRLTIAAAGGLPTLLSQPTSQLIRQGQTASFTVVATGLPGPTLQWRVLLPGASSYVDVPGATSATYTTAPAGLEQNGSRYVVVADTGVATATSSPVTLSVSPFDVAPVVLTDPAPLSVVSGSDAVFAIVARGTEALSYQWRKDGIAIAGANSPVLRLAGVVAAQAGAYSATVTNAAGSATSHPAALAVGAGTPAPVPPTIVTQPVSVLVNAGNTATFAVGVSGSGAIAYQWKRNGQPIPGATAAFYSIAAAAVGDAATYRVQASNGVGAAVDSDNVILTVNQNPQASAVVLSTQPSPQVQAPGGTATFAVAATGSGPFAYQWLKNGAPLAGATSAVLAIGSVTGSDAASYAVTVGNALNTVTSNAAALVVLGSPVITGQPVAASAAEGATALFSVTASGSLLGYQWTRNGIAIAGATGSSYTTAPLALADSGAVYGVVVYNGAGAVFSSAAVLTVTAAVGFPANAVLLNAYDDSNGSELWMTDGTAGGTVLVKDINPGAAFSDPRQFTRFGSHMYFVADDGSSGRELWRTDGTAAGTTRVIDLLPGVQSSNPSKLTACNGALFFGARDGAGTGLFKTDGSAAGTVRLGSMILASGTGTTICMNNVLYFAASTAANGDELWRSDGTVAGTVLVKDIVPGSGNSSPRELTAFLGQVYFAMQNNVTSDGGLWKTDGTAAGTVPVTTGFFSAPSWLTANGATLYFSGVTALGTEPWRSDGTTANTSILANLNLNASSYPYKFTVSNGITYFMAEQFTGSQQLFRTDGSEAGTTAVHVISPGQVAGFDNGILDVNGTLFFYANQTGSGQELWKSDGTDAGTVLVKDIQPGPFGSLPRGLFKIGGVLYFGADDGTGTELWRSDGTAAGTFQVKDLCPGPCSSGPSPN